MDIGNVAAHGSKGGRGIADDALAENGKTNRRRLDKGHD